MTKSTITREESVQAVFDLKVGYRLGFADLEILKRVARMALAAMDGEPVAYMYDGEDGTEYNGHNEFSGGGKGIPLYRHAQPAPVVPYDFDFDRFNDVVWLECVASNPHMHSPTTSIIARVALELNKRILAGNSPVITDGWKMVPIDATRAMIDAARRVEEDGYDAMHKAMLAAAPHDTPALNSVQSVVTVPGKWIPVSERMPEDEQEVLTINRMGHRFVSFFDKHSGLYFDRLDAPAACCIEHVLVTHWMPLPAAPQEVNHG